MSRLQDIPADVLVGDLVERRLVHQPVCTLQWLFATCSSMYQLSKTHDLAVRLRAAKALCKSETIRISQVTAAVGAKTRSKASSGYLRIAISDVCRTAPTVEAATSMANAIAGTAVSFTFAIDTMYLLAAASSNVDLMADITRIYAEAAHVRQVPREMPTDPARAVALHMDAVETVQWLTRDDAALDYEYWLVVSASRRATFVAQYIRTHAMLQPPDKWSASNAIAIFESACRHGDRHCASWSLELLARIGARFTDYEIIEELLTLGDRAMLDKYGPLVLHVHAYSVYSYDTHLGIKSCNPAVALDWLAKRNPETAAEVRTELFRKLSRWSHGTHTFPVSQASVVRAARLLTWLKGRSVKCSYAEALAGCGMDFLAHMVAVLGTMQEGVVKTEVWGVYVAVVHDVTAAYPCEVGDWFRAIWGTLLREGVTGHDAALRLMVADLAVADRRHIADDALRHLTGHGPFWKRLESDALPYLVAFALENIYFGDGPIVDGSNTRRFVMFLHRLSEPACRLAVGIVAGKLGECEVEEAIKAKCADHVLRMLYEMVPAAWSKRVWTALKRRPTRSAIATELLALRDAQVATTATKTKRRKLA